MKPYIIRQGDHLPRLALRMGFDADAVWNHPKNEELKKQRADWHILCSGDVLWVPDDQPPKWLPAAIGSVNTFVATIPKVKLRAVFMKAGKPLAGAQCLVRELATKFTTDGDGALSLSLPLTIERVTVDFLDLKLVECLKVGHLDPADTESGAWQRLQNLGYIDPKASVSDPDDDRFAGAISEFQAKQGLNATGVLDEQTHAKLFAAHGC